MGKPKMICVVGPTACHKTDTAVLLARRLNGEVVSADSAQVYVDMDIGTAKPTVAERMGVPHYLLDCVPIDTPSFSVSQYRELAAAAIDEILGRNHVPVIVGGSGLYINALTTFLNFAVPSDPEVRAQVEAEFDLSPDAAYAKLKTCDPTAAARLHPNDKKRIVRALEVQRISGQSFSSFGGDFSNCCAEQLPWDPVMIGLTMERNLLYCRINARVDQMMEVGLLEEAANIYKKGYSMRLPAMQSIGYRQLFAYFSGECSLGDAVETIKRDTRRFAKRQMTWFQRDKRIQWFDVSDYSQSVQEAIVEYAKENL